MVSLDYHFLFRMEMIRQTSTGLKWDLFIQNDKLNEKEDKKGYYCLCCHRWGGASVSCDYNRPFYGAL